MSEIKKIEHIGTTGGIDGDYSYSFSDNQIVEFIDLLNQVELGGKVDENKASSNGAVSYYTIYFVIDETLTIIPGEYFKIGDTFYEFDNYDELWDKFVGKVFYIASTALIVIGLLCAIGEWYEKQTMSSIYGSMIIQVVGVFEYFLAKVISKENSSFYVKWLNTIIIAFIPISMITSYISELIFKVGGGISPYPIGIFHSFVFLLVYLIVIMVSYAYLKKQNKFLI